MGGRTCRSVVSLELRKGMWLDLLAYAAMTSPSAERLLLMCCASFSRAPVASERPTRSDPAKSTRLSMLDSLLPDRKCCAVTCVMRAHQTNVFHPTNVSRLA